MRFLRIDSASRWIRIATISFGSFIVLGCEPSSVQTGLARSDHGEEVPSKWPTLDQMRAITAPGYISPSQAKQECLGRLVFDVTQPVEWPTFHDKDSYSIFGRSFSHKVADPGDEMRFGDTMIGVISAPTAEKLHQVLETLPNAQIDELEGMIKERSAYLSELLKHDVKSDKHRWEISLSEDAIRSWKATMQEKKEKFESFDPGLPDSQGYWTSNIEANDESLRYSVLRAYLVKKDLIYVFQSAVRMLNPEGKEAHKKAFVAQLAKFRERKQYEIPAELGVCVPFGFLPDDGTTDVEFKQSMRFSDAPGVLYTIETGNVRARRMKVTPLQAVAFAGMSPPEPSNPRESKPIVTQRIGPRPYKIGGLIGVQGGVVLEVSEPGQGKYAMYNLFTGYSGWLGVSVLPYILVEMRSVAKVQASELKENPPPFAQSMDRLDLLLKSMRLRPTKPSMPELTPH